MYYESTDEVRIVPMELEHMQIAVSGRLPKKQARAYIYTCGLDDSTLGIPIALSVLRSQKEDSSNHQQVHSCMPVELPLKPNATRDFAICVPMSYSKLRPDRLIEWLEMQKLLGVSLVGIHCLNVTEPALKVFREYAREGFVDLRYSHCIYSSDIVVGQGQPRLHTTSAVNDCMYRHMYSFKRMLVIDLDEVIFPETFTTLQELISYLDTNITENPINYEFRNNHFFLDIPLNSTLVKDRRYNAYNLTLIKHRMRVPLDPPGFQIKSIINPQACVYMHHHYCWGFTPVFESRPATHEVDHSIATSRHFKRCHYDAVQCAKEFQSATYNGAMTKFADALKERVNSRMATTFKSLVIN
jgi:hypothetical protein